MRLSAVCLFLTILIGAQAQNEARQIAFSAIVCDRETLTPLSQSTLIHNGLLSTADNAGRTYALAEAGDTLTFRHVGYRSATFVVSDSLAEQNIVGIFLSRDTVMLSEVVVRPRIFRMPTVLTPLELNPKDIAAQQNMKRSVQAAFTAPKTLGTWDQYDNQNMVQSRYEHDIIYKTQVAPDEMVGLSVGTLYALYKLIAEDKQQTDAPVPPLSLHEAEMLLRAFQNEQQSDAAE